MSENVSTILNVLSAELEECRQLSHETPLINPYQQLSYRLSKKMNAGDLATDQVDNLVSELGIHSFLSRGRRGQAYLQTTDRAKNKASLLACFQDVSKGKTFEEFQNFVRREVVGIVITGHPTFGFSKGQYDVLAGLIDGSMSQKAAAEKLKKNSERPDEGLTLEYEYIQSERALLNLQHAIGQMYELKVPGSRFGGADGLIRRSISKWRLWRCEEFCSDISGVGDFGRRWFRGHCLSCAGCRAAKRTSRKNHFQ